MDVEVSFRTDSDGFLSRQCPKCVRRFKSISGEGSDQPISCCPYCGHRDRGNWLTDEQTKYAMAVAADAVITPELNKMARKFNRQLGGGGLLKISMDVKRGSKPRAPVESNNSMLIVRFACCNERIKHDGRATALHCVICGKQSNV